MINNSTFQFWLEVLHPEENLHQPLKGKYSPQLIDSHYKGQTHILVRHQDPEGTVTKSQELPSSLDQPVSYIS